MSLHQVAGIVKVLMYSISSVSSQPSPSKTNKRTKIIESLLSQKLNTLNDLRKVAWNGIPFGIHIY